MEVIDAVVINLIALIVSSPRIRLLSKKMKLPVRLENIVFIISILGLSASVISLFFKQ